MSQEQERRLAGPEIDLKSGGAVMPVLLPASGNQLAAQLWRLGLVHVWYRRSLASNRLEGGFYTLTRDGQFRAEHLMTARQNRAPYRPTPTYDELYASDNTPPPVS